MNFNTRLNLLLILWFANVHEAKHSKLTSLNDRVNNTVKTDWTWSDLNNLIKRNVDVFLNANLKNMLKFEATMNLSESCQETMQKAVFGLRKAESWVMQMIDASGRPPSGILDGTVMDMGSWDECMRIRVNITDQDPFRGRYCMIGFRIALIAPISKKTATGQSYIEAYGEPPKWIADSLERGGGFLDNIMFWFGICVPSACTEQDVLNTVSTMAGPIGVEAHVADCQTDEQRPLENYEMISICMLGFLFCATIIGTLTDSLFYTIWKSHHPKEVSSFGKNRLFTQLLKSFSLLSNTKRLFQCDSGLSPLSCYHGMRFLSATWVILGHTYFYIDTWKYLKYTHLWGFTDQFNKYLPAAVIENFSMPVGTFFFMSGCLIVFTNWIKMEENDGKMNVIYFFVHRFWRMTPDLVFMLVLLFGLPLIDSGPLWYTNLKPEIEVCQRNWWRNVLYISNFWDSDDICMIHTWYLAALMQYHVIAVLLLLLIFRWPIIGWIMGLIVLVGSCVWTALLVVWNDFPMPALGTVKDLDVIKHYNSDIYVKPFAHIGSYIVGMITGYILLKYKDVKLGNINLILGWTAAIVCGLTSVYGLYGPADVVEVRAIYIALHRIGWALFLGWVTFVCAIGQGGLINSFLSWRAFQSLGQLSYLAYLLHPLVIIYRSACLKERVYYGHTQLVFEYIGNVVVGFFLAFVGYILVELPFATMEGLVLSRRKKTLLSNFNRNSDTLVKTVVVKQDKTIS